MNSADAIDRSIDWYSETTAVVAAESGQTRTYADLDDRSTRLANALAARVGDRRVATLTVNGIPAIETMLASQKRGLANVHLPFRSSWGSLVSMLGPTGAEALIFDDATADTAVRVLEESDLAVGLHAGEARVDRADVESYEAVVESAATAPPEPDPRHEFGVFYTSGTTSTPKAVLFDQEQMWLGSTQDVMEMGIEPVDTALVCSPWYHMVTNNAWILPHLQAGATQVVLPDFDPHDVLSSIEAHEITGVLAVPTQLRALIAAQREKGYDVDSLSYLRTAGAPVSATLVEAVSDHLTEAVFNTYGLTEGGANLTFAHPSLQAEHPGTVGVASYMWEVRVVETAPPDEDPDPSAVVDPGEVGEILGRSPGMCEGYLDNPEATERLFVDGWLRPGDVAEVDADGNLYIVDRVDNMILSGGENVYPAEVRSVLETHDQVEESVVLGIPDDQWGERVASVVRVEGEVGEADLDAYCKRHENLADFKRPREYVLIDDSLPRTETGTVKREQLRAEYFA
jgi:acyl-CoA synthetase (AMP-forming)/AMP-acid ligase II